MELKSGLLKAPAKVNWHLAVGSRRPDGYHGISSIFQTCSLCDDIYIEITDGPFSVEVTGLEALCEKGCSTIDKAVKLWHSVTGFDYSVKVNVVKNIPSQAGLGGGSSDAATVLLYLNSISDCPFTPEALVALSAGIGCDVPFFTSLCRTAHVSSLGEVIEPVESQSLKGFIIVPSTTKVSTAQAYKALDSRSEIPRLESKEELVEMYRRPCSQWHFRNDFDLVNTKPPVELEPGEVLLLTGSGSCHVLLTERPALEVPFCRTVPVTF